MGKLGDSLISDSTSGNRGNHMPVKECLINGVTEKCESGACCDNECCPFYYELWWFWLIWALTIMMSCCCAYHHRRKQRLQRLDANHNPAIPAQDNYVGGSNYPGPPIDNNSLGYAKLPLYNDVIRIPPTSSPPPPYSSRKKPVHAIACLEPTDNGETVLTIVPCNVTSSMLSLASLSHYIPDILSKANIKTIKDTFAGKTAVAANTDDITTSVTSLEKDTESLKSSGSVKSFSKRLKRSLKSSLLSVKEQPHHDDVTDDEDLDDVSSISSSEEMLNGSYLWMSNGGTDPNNNNFESRGDFLVMRMNDSTSMMDESFMESLSSLATRVDEEKNKLGGDPHDHADHQQQEGSSWSAAATDSNNNITAVEVDRKADVNRDTSISDLIEDPQTYSESVNASLTSLTVPTKKDTTRKTFDRHEVTAQMSSRRSFDRHGVTLPSFP